MVGAPCAIDDPAATFAASGSGGRLRRGLLALLALALLALLVARVDLRTLAHALSGADLRLLLLAGALNLVVGIGACAARLGALLAPLPSTGPPPTRGELARLYLASSAAHNLLPSPAGEVLRTVQLRRRHGYELSALLAAQLVEKLIEAAGLGLLLFAASLDGGVPHAVGAAMLPLSLVVAGGAVALLYFARRRPSTGFFGRLADGMRLSGSPRPLVEALAWTCLSDVANAATVGLCLASLGLSAGVGAWFIVVLVNRLAGVIPATPGQIGVLEGGIVLALGALHVAAGPALGFALLYHAVHLLPVTAVGLLELRRLS